MTTSNGDPWPGPRAIETNWSPSPGTRGARKSAERKATLNAMAVIAVIMIVFVTIALVAIALFVFAPNRQPANWPAALSAVTARA